MSEEHAKNDVMEAAEEEVANQSEADPGDAQRDNEGPIEAEASHDKETRQEPDPIGLLEDEVHRLKDERDQLQEKLLRQAAEFQNFKRRTERDQAQMLESGKVQALLPMLEVLDDLERSLQAAVELEQTEEPGPAYVSLRDGVDQVHQKFIDELQRLGVEPIEAVGQPFNEKEHEAMMQQPAPEDAEPGIVLQEIKRGYRMGDRVIRHSQVIVAS